MDRVRHGDTVVFRYFVQKGQNLASKSVKQGHNFM